VVIPSMTLRTLLCSLLFLGSAAWAQIPEIESPHEFNSLPVARLVYIDDTALTVGNFGDYLYNLGIHPAGVRERDLDSLKASLDWYIDETIICRDLDSAAILAQPESRRRMRWRMAHRAGPLTYTHLVAPGVNVSQEEVAKFYQDSLTTIFTAPSRREVRHLLIAPRDSVSPDGKRTRGRIQVEAARRRADSLKQAVLAGAPFETLAGAFSDDTSSRAQNGYLGWLFPGNTVHDFDSAAFAATPGELVGPVKTLYGYHLIRVEGVRPESTIVYNDTIGVLIRRQLESAKGRALGTAWADSLVSATRWHYNDSALERVPNLEPSVWLVTLNDRDTMWWGEWEGAWELYRRQQNITDAGTLDDKHASLRGSAFPYLYLQVAEDKGFANDSLIEAERWQYLRSEALRTSKDRLYTLQAPPEDSIDPHSAPASAPEPEKKLHLLQLRACDTATIWAAYRRLWAGDDFHSVARRYHDNVRDIASRAYDLGWVEQDELPVELWGKAWILEPGKFTRPVPYDSCYYILKLEDRPRAMEARELRNKEIEAVRREHQKRGLEEWRAEVRKGHRIRLDRSYWQRVQQLWRR